MQTKKGDVVQLLTGGPRMAVEGFTSDGEIRCVWFEERLPKSWGDLKRATFEAAVLEVAPDKVDKVAPVKWG